MEFNENQDSILAHHELSRTLRVVRLSKVNNTSQKSTNHRSFEILTLVSVISQYLKKNQNLFQVQFVMASCSFSSLFKLTSPCGSSSKNPDLQCVPLNECNKEVYSHFKSLKIGSDEAICEEMALLLARAGTVSRLND